MSDFQPFLFKKKIKQSNAAAIAIRDNVTPFQKFGSRLFTWPYLNISYGKSIYITEYTYEEKKITFIKSLDSLLNDYEAVDVFLLAHANYYYEWVQEIDSIKRRKIRIVYNTGCSGATQQGIWSSLGVKTYIGHESDKSISPVFYFYFLRRWCAGMDVKASTNDSNKNMLEKLNRLNIRIDQEILKGSCGAYYGSEKSNLND